MAAKSLNQVQLIGNLGADPDIKTFDNDKQVIRVSVACNFEFKKNEETVTQTEWITCEAWNGLGGVFAKYAKKGDRVFIQGRLKTDKFTDDNGVERFFTKVIVNDLILLGSPNGNARGDDQVPMSDDEIPF